MSRLHSTLVAFVLGAAATTGLLAMVRTIRLGQTVAAPKPALVAQELAARRAKLARWSRSLQLARAKHPPALPKIPHFAPVQTPPAAPPAAPAAPATQVTYARPRAVVTYRRASSPHTSTGSSKSSSSDDGRSDDGGGDSSGGGD